MLVQFCEIYHIRYCKGRAIRKMKGWGWEKTEKNSHKHKKLKQYNMQQEGLKKLQTEHRSFNFIITFTWSNKTETSHIYKCCKTFNFNTTAYGLASICMQYIHYM